MGNEIRRVPANWEHPTDESGGHVSLFEGDYQTAAARYAAEEELWKRGRHRAQLDSWNRKNFESFSDYCDAPVPGSYMFDAPRNDLTHLALYESTTEGTPLSPPFSSLPELIDWGEANGFPKEHIESFHWEMLERERKAIHATKEVSVLELKIANGDAVEPEKTFANRIVYYDASGKVLLDESRPAFRPFVDAFDIKTVGVCSSIDLYMDDSLIWHHKVLAPATPPVLLVSSFSFPVTAKDEPEQQTAPDRSSVMAVLRSIANGELEHADIPRDKAAEALEIADRAQSLVEFYDDGGDW